MTENDENDNQKRTVGRPFQPGDERINRHGAPAFHAFRKQALEIANETIIGPDGKEITRGEALLRSWLKSRQPKLQELFAFYAWGKPADRLETNAFEPGTRLILRWAHEADRELSPFDFMPENVAREMRRRLKGPEAP